MHRRIGLSGHALFVFIAIIIIGALAGSGSGAVAAPSDDGIWRDISEASLKAGGERVIIPTRYRTVALDQAALQAKLAQAPLEFTAAARAGRTIISLPLPDGTFGHFSIANSPIMEPGLAAKFPEMSTYVAQGIDDPNATARLDWTMQGFHAIILSPSGTVFIDPYRRNDVTTYISYLTKDYKPSQEDMALRAKEIGIIKDDTEHLDHLPQQQQLPPSGGVLRTYRLAMAATGEYTAAHGGTVAGGMSGITTSVNRVNAVYEREVAVRMVLVANNNLIVYTNGATDPYTNNNGFTMLGENQTNITNVIGTANYDVGHVFSTGGGGVANLRCICVSTNKARGVTGSPNPVGDPFDIDYVAHEIGHQFGGNHTFNGTTSSCGGGNRNASTAFEPGSGSTIMAYAGICGAENLQPNSDPYFHTGNFDEIIAFITTGTGDTCAVKTNTGNQPPTANAGPDHMIPMQTPFGLTGIASDPDGHPLTHHWEQFDAGTQAPPNTDNGSRAIFRSFNPVPADIRTLPALPTILNNTTVFGESLPTTTREMTFRYTARDNRAGGGGVANDTMSVNVTATAGPFVVTVPNTAVTWTGSTQQTVTWNVANTTAAPVSCANVTILLSTDGGQTFPTTLLASTPNDGSAPITVPNIATTTARIKVICATSIFFDLSNANFTIQQGAPQAILAFSKSVAPTTGLQPGSDVSYTLTVANSGSLAATTTISDTFATGLINPVCNGTPGNLQTTTSVGAGSSTTINCTARIDPAIRLELDVTASETSVAPGASVTYVITVLNPSASLTYTNVTVNPGDLTTCTPNPGTATTLTPGQSQVYTCPNVVIDSTITRTVIAAGTLSIANRASATSPQDPNSPVLSNTVTSSVGLAGSDSVQVIVGQPSSLIYLPQLMKQ